MDLSDVIYFIVAFISLVFSYKFTIIQKSYQSLSSLKLQKLEEQNVENYSIVKSNFENIESINLVSLFLDYLFNMLAGTMVCLFFYHHYDNIGIVIGIFISIVFVLVFGELLPSSIAVQKYEEIVVRDAKLARIINGVFKPIVGLFSKFANLFVNLFGGNRNYVEPLITEDDFKNAVSLSVKEGILDRSEVDIIENIMDFSESLAKDIMTPRTDIVAIDIDSSFDEIFDVIKTENFSRMPVYETDLDNIIGIFHIKDIFEFDQEKSLRGQVDLLRQPFYTYEYKPVSKLFNEMRHKKVSFTVVNNEYGGTEGIITTEDLLERIVGSIVDEYDDEDDEEIIKLTDNEYIVDGSMNLDDLNHFFNLELDSEEVDSIAGYLIERVDRFPKVNEVFNIDNIAFIIKETSKNRIDKILMRIDNE